MIVHWQHNSRSFIILDIPGFLTLQFSFHRNGPATQHNPLSILKDWYGATRQIPEISKTIHYATEADRKAAIINTGPADATANCSVLFATLVYTARQRLWMTSPFS